MKAIFLTLLLFTVLVPQSAQKPDALQGTAKDDEQELRNLTRKVDEAWVAKDSEMLKYVLFDNYTLSGLPTEQLLAAVKLYDTTYEFMRRDITRVSVYDDIAVVSGLLTERGRSRGVDPYTSEFSFADVWARLQGRWQCVSTQLGDARGKGLSIEKIRGPERKASLVVYFKTDVAERQISKLLTDLRDALTLKRRLVGGEIEICDVLSVYPALQGHVRIAVNFCDGIGKEERDGITAAIKGSALVYKVMENVAPVDVRTIEQ